MKLSARLTAFYAALCMIIVVFTQALYMINRSAELGIDPAFIWMVEAVAFLGMTVFALVTLVGRTGLQIAWAAIGIGALLNVIQVAMGMAMFGPLEDAGDAMAPAFQAVLAGAFFFYFAGKFLFGIAAVVLGWALFTGAPSIGKMVGAMSVITGVAAVGFNLVAMAVGMQFALSAGAAGTIATFMLALCAIMTANRPIRMR